MANEIKYILSLSVSKNGAKLTREESNSVDMSGESLVHQIQNIGTTPEDINQLTELGTSGYLYVKNLHSSNYVLLGTKNYKLAYDGQSGNYTNGLKVTGGTSGATGWIVYDDDGGATGTLVLTDVSGTFQNDETLTDSSSGSATINGTISDGKPSFFCKIKAGESVILRTSGNDELMAMGNSSACDIEYIIVED